MKRVFAIFCLLAITTTTSCASKTNKSEASKPATRQEATSETRSSSVEDALANLPDPEPLPPEGSVEREIYDRVQAYMKAVHSDIETCFHPGPTTKAIASGTGEIRIDEDSLRIHGVQRITIQGSAGIYYMRSKFEIDLVDDTLTVTPFEEDTLLPASSDCLMRTGINLKSTALAAGMSQVDLILDIRKSVKDAKRANKER